MQTKNQRSRIADEARLDHTLPAVVALLWRGDRFEIWSRLEREIDRKIEIILYEKCRFQDHVDKHGMKVF